MFLYISLYEVLKSAYLSGILWPCFVPSLNPPYVSATAIIALSLALHSDVNLGTWYIYCSCGNLPHLYGYLGPGGFKLFDSHCIFVT